MRQAVDFGPQAALLQPGMRASVPFVEGTPTSVLFPDILEVRVAETTPPVHQQADTVWKPARTQKSS